MSLIDYVQTKEYIVTVYNRDHLLSIYEDLEIKGNAPANIDIIRAVECTDRRPSSRNTVYRLTNWEAQELKNDPRVRSVELIPSELGIQAGTTTITQTSTAWDKSSNETSDMKNWGLLRCVEGVQRTGWGSTGYEGNGVGTPAQTGTINLTQSGKNVDVVIVDGNGIVFNHPEYAVNADGTGGSRAVQYNWAQHNPQVTGGAAGTYTYSISDHATHVAGTVAARGATSSAKGMAPKALIRSYNWDSDEVEVANEITNNALLISNHSYGIPIYNDQGNLNVPVWFMGCYNTDARNWDEIAYNFPYYLGIMSAGNNGTSTYDGGLAFGYDKLTGNKNTKNLMIVANANPNVHPVTGAMTSLVINNSSSQGPTDDGRIKPDIAADGTSLYSTSNVSDTSYDTSTGTSMASPSVAGGLILIQEHYNDLHPSEFMRSASLKGLACHTALDDAASVGPDPKFGWGLLDTRESVIVLNNSISSVPTSIVDELVLNQGGT
jgi:hypothetical protein